MTSAADSREGVAPSRIIPESIRRRFGITAAVSPATLWKSALCLGLFKAKGIECGLVRCAGHLPMVYGGGEVRIGAEFGLDSRMTAIELGATKGGILSIGDRVAIGSGASLVASLEIDIGDDVMIGDRVGIFDNDFHAVDSLNPKRRAPVRIRERAWVCRSALVMPGVEIGPNSVVAAGSVVTKSVPANSLAAGVPARVIRELNIPDGWRRSRVD